MNLVIISGSIRTNNGSLKTSHLIRQSAPDAEIVTIEDFIELLQDEYIYFSNATAEQRKIMEKIRDADALIFVVPTYFKSLPGALKNFLDIVREESLYAHKVIGFLASNHKNQDFGARECRKILEGIIEFFDSEAVFVSEIPISDPAHPDQAAIDKIISLVTQLQAHYLNAS